MMRNGVLRGWCSWAAVLLFLLPGPASGQEYDLSTLDDLEGSIEELMDGWGVPGLAVGVISMNDDGAEYVKTFGYSDLEEGIPVTPQTVFGIGSCAKAFTAAAAAALVTDGALTWDTPVHELVPSFRLFDDYVTLHATPRDLLSHRTGLGGYDMLSRVCGGGRDRLWERVAHLEPTEGFRERFQYSNLSYLMAGKLVEDVAGEPFEDFVHRRLLRPIGMTSTTLSLRQASEAGRLATPYTNCRPGHEFGDGARRSPDFDGVGDSTEQLTAPLGGVYSSLEDMMKWARFHLSGGAVGEERVLSKRAERAMFNAQKSIWFGPDDEQAYLAYGMGWFVEDYRGHPMVQHEGQVYGYMARVTFLPREGLGVVVLTNSYYHHVHSILTKTIFDRLLGLSEIDRSGVLEEFRNVARSLSQQHQAFWDARPADAGPPTRPLEHYTGTFSNPIYGSVSVGLEGDSLRVTFGNDVTLDLRHFAGDAFATDTVLLDYFDQFVRFGLVPDGTVEEVRFDWDGGTVFGRVAEE